MLYYVWGDFMVKFKLRMKLAELGMSQKELSEKSGIRIASVNAYYHNTAKSISLENINSLCDVLNCDISDILEYNRDKSEESNISKLLSEYLNFNPKDASNIKKEEMEFIKVELQNKIKHQPDQIQDAIYKVYEHVIKEEFGKYIISKYTKKD